MANYPDVRVRSMCASVEDMNQHWWKERKEAVAALFVGLLAGALLTVGVPALAAPAAVQVPDGQFNLACSVINGQVSCLGNLPTAPPTTPPPTTAPPTTTPPATTTPPVVTTPPTTPTTPPPVTSMDPAWWVANTGIPPFATLTPYTGPCTIRTANTVITNKTINCPDRLIVMAAGVRITNSKIVGGLDVESGHATLTTSEVDAGQNQWAAVGYREFTLVRVNAHGGQHGAQCDANCSVTDSWLHGQYLPGNQGWHLNGFISNGGHDIVLTHNRLECNPRDNGVGGGCTADASIFGDFSANSRFTLDRNLFMAEPGSYCAYGGTEASKPGKPDHIVFTNNVFQRGANGRCASYGAITSFDSNAPGNVWTNNTWDTGGVLNP